MIIKSSERSTGMGASSFTAVLVDGKWVAVSDAPDCHSLGRNHGWDEYEIDVPSGTAWARFYRSNSGKEEVQVTTPDGVIEFKSFSEARRWASEQTIGVGVVIVTRHAGLVEWLAAHGITGAVIAQAAPDDVSGKHVVGALPLHLAALAERGK